MPKPYPREFREDVVAVAHKGDAPIAEVAKDFRIARLDAVMAQAAGA